ncbi:MAG: aminotransferase class III-fold pyridoxal phosphate-dependent enzyme [Phycisphaerales bacterium]|nr:aminotransferase class III-fold pyridoxal phosphate-dependent enzyme [Phycisphaerales bacterium]
MTTHATPTPAARTSSSNPDPGGTKAAALMASKAVSASIDALVEELRRHQSALTGARPATAALQETYESWLARHAEARGKAALYPYVGSGIGNGALVELADGSVKWDMINGIGVHMFGHSDPDMVATALRAAMSDTVMEGNLQFNADSIVFAETLVAEAARGSRLRHCFVTNSGCMANESALKICLQKNHPAPRVIAFADCFMGRSTTMAQIGDSAAGRVGLPLNVLVDYMPFYDPEHGTRSIDYAVWHLRQMIARYPGQYACFVMELVQGEGGFNQAPREYFVALMEVCKEHGIAVWADEVQTFGRTESMFHFQQLDLGAYVDVATIGKMSQACAAIYSEEYNPKPGLLSGTFIGGAVELQVGARVLERMRDGGYYGPDGRNARLQEAFRARAAKLVESHPEWFTPVPHPSGLRRVNTPYFGGVGGMMRLTPFGGDKGMVTKALAAMFEEGVVAFYCGHGPFHVRFLPPVGVMEPDHFDEVFEITERAFARVAAG